MQKYLIPRVNEAGLSVQYESCEYKCRLNENLYNLKQKCNHDECRRDCKELDDSGSVKDDYMWNPITCDCECNKACKIDEETPL